MVEVGRTATLEKILLINRLLINNFSELFSDDEKKEVELEIKEAEEKIKVRKNGKA